MSSRFPSPSPSSSSSASDDIDLAYLDNIYQSLMSTILDVEPTSVTPRAVPDEPTTAVEGEDKVDAGSGGAKNAKRRKMDKKRAKREEQKLAAEEVVDAVEFKLFSRTPVKLVSLLPAEEPIWTTQNPRHVPLTDKQTQEMRRKIGSVVVDNADVLSVEREGTMATRELTAAGLPENTVLHLTIPRRLPAYSAAFLSTHPSYAPPPPSKIPKPPAGKKSAKNSVTTMDPVVEALKRTRTQTQQRTHVHVRYTTNGRILPPGKPHHTTAVPVVDIPTVKIDKGHLRRLARRAHRFGHLPTPPDHTHSHLPVSTKPATPWVNPFIPAARFWSAPEEVGGKSGGYAYGFAGSAVGTREKEEGRRRGGVYVRDRMR